MINKIHVIIPVYNEGRSIYSLLEQFDSFAKLFKLKFNLVVVNDNSSDDSQLYIDKAIKDFRLDINCIKHKANLGLHGSLTTGFNSLKSINDEDIIITLDGDNTHNPHLIREFIYKINEGADIVIASRYCEQSRVYGLSKLRHLLSIGAKFLYSIRWRIPGVKDYTCNFRGYKGWLISKANEVYGDKFITEKGFTATTEILKKINKFKPIIVEVPMILKYSNKENASNMNVFKTIVQTIKILFKI